MITSKGERGNSEKDKCRISICIEGEVVDVMPAEIPSLILFFNM